MSTGASKVCTGHVLCVWKIADESGNSMFSVQPPSWALLAARSLRSVPPLGFRVWDSRCGVWGVGCGISGVGCEVWGVEFGVWGLGLRV
jgi:hypothetical protein